MAIFLPTNILNQFQYRPTVETSLPNRSLFPLSLPLHLGGPGWPSKSVGIGSALCSCLLMWPFTHLQVLVDMDGNTNDPSWAPLLSCFKPGDILQYPFLAPTCRKRWGQGFSLHLAFMGFMTLFPSSYLHNLWLFSHRLELAGMENKQIMEKQTQQLITM